MKIRTHQIPGADGHGWDGGGINWTENPWTMHRTFFARGVDGQVRFRFRFPFMVGWMDGWMDGFERTKEGREGREDAKLIIGRRNRAWVDFKQASKLRVRNLI